MWGVLHNLESPEELMCVRRHQATSGQAEEKQQTAQAMLVPFIIPQYHQ